MFVQAIDSDCGTTLHTILETLRVSEKDCSESRMWS